MHPTGTQLYQKTTGIHLNSGWVSTAGAAIAPTGTITQYAGPTAPSGYLLCDGSAVSRTTYSDLFAICGTLYGAGDGSTTFNVPDLRGRTSVGYAASGGHTDVSTLGNNDGVAAANRRPKHRHTPHAHGTPFTALESGGAAAFTSGSQSPNNYNTNSADGGSGNANDSLDAPAYLVINKIIKT